MTSTVNFGETRGAVSERSAAKNLLGLTRDELEQFAVAAGQPRYRGAQLYEGIYRRRARDFDRLTSLSQEFRRYLAAHARLAHLAIRGQLTSRDGSVRYLFGLEDGNTIEAVYMPEENRTTLCISSQVGCAVDCRFCFTALVGVRRNLAAGEIAGQVLAIAEDKGIAPKSRLNVVFMGQGEPLLNLGPVMKAVQILADPAGCGVALRRITISTSGIVPRIYDLGREPVRPKLAVSLNASTDEQRETLMPINRKYPIAKLIEACRAYPLRPRERITFEYVMLEGLNDADADARRVAALVRDIPSRVNLIPYNPGEALPYRPSPLARVVRFQEALAAARVPAFIRVSRGRDIMAACGQLSLADVERTGRLVSPE